MGSVVSARGLSKQFGSVRAVDDVAMDLPPGTILGLIGPNGAGKTTLLRALLGLTAVEGELSVLGQCPRRQRAALMERVCFIADTALLPSWMRVRDLLDYVQGVHPNFDRSLAEQFLADTNVQMKHRVRELSKGMTVQLHLSVVMAVDAKLLILDEPTLGLDVLFRKRFFDQLINDYFDGDRTIIISTHQVEEVENILTDVTFMDRGKFVLQQSMSTLEEQYLELHAVGERAAQAAAIPHVGSRSILGGKAFIYEGVDRQSLASLGDLRTPSLTDLFVATIQGQQL